MTIRARSAADHDAIVTLSVRAWTPVFASVDDVLGEELSTLLHGADWRVHQAREVRETLGDASQRIWVAELNAQVVGFMAAAVVDQQRMIGEITMVAVDPAAQGRGVGRALTEHAAGWLRDQGIRVAVVETGGDSGHAPARRVYERLGFRSMRIARDFRALPPA
jgi:ribosomal protein S18 acetylase RimI-like enzyme